MKTKQRGILVVEFVLVFVIIPYVFYSLVK